MANVVKHFTGKGRLVTAVQYWLTCSNMTTVHISGPIFLTLLNYHPSTSYLEDAGVPEDKAPYATLGVGATMVTMAIVTIPLMDRIGRRVLHLGGLLGMVLFGVALTVLQVVSTKENDETVAILGCHSVLVVRTQFLCHTNYRTAEPRK